MYVPPYVSPFYKKQLKKMKEEKRMVRSTVMAKHELFKARNDYTKKIREDTNVVISKKNQDKLKGNFLNRLRATFFPLSRAYQTWLQVLKAQE